MSNTNAGHNAYVLDDEVQVGTIVCHALVATGFEPRQFTSPLPFLSALKASPPELIVLDLALGQSDAIEVIRQLKVVKYAGNVLLVSGRDEATLAEFTQIGEHHGLAMLEPLKKPFRVHDLKNRLTPREKSSRAEANKVPPEIRAAPRFIVDLGEALRNRWTELCYQPKIDLKRYPFAALRHCCEQGIRITVFYRPQRFFRRLAIHCISRYRISLSRKRWLIGIISPHRKVQLNWH